MLFEQDNDADSPVHREHYFPASSLNFNGLSFQSSNKPFVIFLLALMGSEDSSALSIIRREAGP